MFVHVRVLRGNFYGPCAALLEFLKASIFQPRASSCVIRSATPPRAARSRGLANRPVSVFVVTFLDDIVVVGECGYCAHLRF